MTSTCVQPAVYTFTCDFCERKWPDAAWERRGATVTVQFTGTSAPASPFYLDACAECVERSVEQRASILVDTPLADAARDALRVMLQHGVFAAQTTRLAAALGVQLGIEGPRFVLTAPTDGEARDAEARARARFGSIIEALANARQERERSSGCPSA